MLSFCPRIALISLIFCVIVGISNASLSKVAPVQVGESRGVGGCKPEEGVQKPFAPPHSLSISGISNHSTNISSSSSSYNISSSSSSNSTNHTIPHKKKDDDDCKTWGWLMTFENYGGVAVEIFIVLYMFLALAIICDEYFEPCMHIICQRLRITPDIAGASFMAFGNSAPEIFISCMAMVHPSQGNSNAGAGTIIGSGVFSFLFIIGAAALFARNAKRLKPLAVLRDLWAYIVSVALLIVYMYINDGKITWWESLIFIILYLFFLIGLKMFNPAYALLMGIIHPELRSKHGKEVPKREPPKKKQPLLRSLTLEYDMDAEDEEDKIGDEEWGTAFSPVDDENGIDVEDDEELPTVRKERPVAAILDEMTSPSSRSKKSGEKDKRKNKNKKKIPPHHQHVSPVPNPTEEQKGLLSSQGINDGDDCGDDEPYSDYVERPVEIGNIYDDSDSSSSDDYDDEEEVLESSNLLAVGGTRGYEDDGFGDFENAHDEKHREKKHRDGFFAPLDTMIPTHHDGKLVFEYEDAPEDEYDEIEKARKRDYDQKRFLRKIPTESTWKLEDRTIHIAVGRDGKIHEEGFDPEQDEPIEIGEVEEKYLKEIIQEEEKERKMKKTILFILWLPWTLLKLPLVLLFKFTLPPPDWCESKYFLLRQTYIITFILCVAYIGVASYVLLEMATRITCFFNIGHAFVGLTILGIGSDVPDVLNAVSASRKGHSDMAVASAIGGQIINVFIGLGLPWFISSLDGHPVTLEKGTFLISIFILAASVALFLVLIILLRWRLNRLVGLLLMCGYGCYLVYLMITSL